ncbi:MAG: 3-deoxy-D-manno-octulosonic acid transferase [Sedimentisphaerales bacterium]|nr:3-deoxy-D-manno-octulosonic acid transferase [Sedimentisphaerales bacterium]
MICILLDIFYAIILVLLSPWVLYRMFFQSRYRTGWKERFGFVPLRKSSDPCIWIHAVSMGEINAIATLVQSLQHRLPDHEIVISSTTDTGMDRARKLYGDKHLVFFYPWDFSWAVKKAFSRLRPSLCVLMELEVWHNFTTIAHHRSIPVMVANGRISSGKGFPRYRRIAGLVRPMFRRLSLVLTQDNSYTQRFQFLGVDPQRIRVVGSLKYDTAEIVDKVPGTDQLIEQLKLSPPQPVWVAGSTTSPEEEIILESFSKLRRGKSLKKLRLVLVPRKPERFDEVARLIENHNFKLLRYSKVKTGQYQPTSDDADAVILGDTMGDLRKFYSLAEVIFVGRSLVPVGGSDMIEAAALAKPVVVGPFTENFTESVKMLVNAAALEVVADGNQLARITQNLLQDKNAAAQLGKNAQHVIIANQGATEKTVNEISNLLKNPKS